MAVGRLSRSKKFVRGGIWNPRDSQKKKRTFFGSVTLFFLFLFFSILAYRKYLWRGQRVEAEGVDLVI